LLILGYILPAMNCKESRDQPSSHLGAAGPVRLIVVLDLMDGAKRAGVLWSCGPNKSFCWVERDHQEKVSITSVPKPIHGRTL